MIECVKYFVLILAICLSATLVACGSESSSGAAQSGPELTEVAGAPNPPDVQLPPGPFPKKLVVKDLKIGSGAVVKEGAQLRVQYVDAAYPTGHTYEVRWRGDHDKPLSFVLGAGSVNKGWEIGLKGMKVGGRRELRVPARLSIVGVSKVYVVELLAIEAEAVSGGAQS
jgi:hypothetical protein